jgi:hypothetical protein
VSGSIAIVQRIPATRQTRESSGLASFAEVAGGVQGVGVVIAQDALPPLEGIAVQVASSRHLTELAEISRQDVGSAQSIAVIWALCVAVAFPRVLVQVAGGLQVAQHAQAEG